MNKNGHNGKHPSMNSGYHADAPSLLANLIIPGAEFDADSYARLRLRLDLYDDYILARKFQKTGQPDGGFYALDPLDTLTALAGLTLGSPLLPSGCLFWQRAEGGERLGIYAPPQVWPVNVSAGKDRERLAVPMPGLVWIGQGTTYSLYAVKAPSTLPTVAGQGEWPGKDTELWKAPCPNVGDRGICSGNVAFPQAGAETIWPALRLFFESDFNDHLSNGKSKKHPKSVLAAWRKLAGRESWPEDDLEPAGVTLGKVVGR